MAIKTLTVSFLEDRIDLLKVEQGVTYTFTALDRIQTDVNQETLDRAARWADQIFINSDFPSAVYQWASFPKVQYRHQIQLVARHASKILDAPEGVRVAFQDEGTVLEKGVPKRRIAYLAVPENEVARLENDLLGRFKQKIVRVTALPVALAAAVVQAEHPDGDFMIIWIGEMSTIFAVSSAQGDVRVARNIPVGLKRHELPEEPTRREEFSKELDRDITTTLLLYGDRFGQQKCEKFYFLGNRHLQEILEEFPLKSVPKANSWHGIPSPLIQREKTIGPESEHLLGTLFVRRSFNLVDRSIIWGRRFEKGYRLSLTALTVMIIAALAWMFMVAPPTGEDQRAAYELKKEELQRVNRELYRLEEKQIELKRYGGWRDFYKNTYINQPAWAKMFSSLAATIPEQFVIKRFRIMPGEGEGVHGWSCVMEGHIKVDNWNDGLELLRTFGASIHQTPYFDIDDIKYTTLEGGDEKKEKESGSGPDDGLEEFDFEIRMKLTALEKESHEN